MDLVNNFQKAKDLFLAGIAHLDKEAFEDAERNFLASLVLAPNRPSTLTNLAATQIRLKKYLEARSTCEKVLSIDASNSEALLNLGLTYKETKDFVRALFYFDKAIEVNPDYAQAWSNRGSALSDLHQHQNALSAFDKAISLSENYYEAWSNRGLTLFELKQYKDALLSHEKAICIAPNYSDAWFNKGSTYLSLKDFHAALNAYKKAMTLNPKLEYVLGDLIHSQLMIGDWDGLDINVQMASKEINLGFNVSSPFPMLSATDNPKIHLQTATLWAKNKHSNPKKHLTSSKNLHTKIRIAYFSPDFRDHPVSLLTAELYQLHNRDQFEVFAFSLQGCDLNHPIRKRLITGFDQFINAENKTDYEIAQLARELEIDIAIDLCGYTQHARTGIFFNRAAPIQVNYLGYPGTLGAECIDYIIADHTLITKLDERFYTEKVAYLPNSYMVDDSSRIASSRRFTKSELGLPEDTFIFCCFNNSYKFNKETLVSWSKILLRVPNSVLWISENNKDFMGNLLKEFSGQGISSERIIFADRLELIGDHLARCAIADLFLDTLPFNAHTTAVDSLKAKVPVLTLSGNAFAGRVGASLLNAIHLPELITRTREEYEAMAIDLATNPEKLSKIKQKLLFNQKTTPLFNADLFKVHLEAAYIKMYDRHQKDLPCDHIHV
jgi:predicted O-linked N-acetylglucosamine transferase (SPINDLY family)